jgi:hypothetical protein
MADYFYHFYTIKFILAIFIFILNKSRLDKGLIIFLYNHSEFFAPMRRAGMQFGRSASVNT